MQAEQLLKKIAVKNYVKMLYYIQNTSSLLCKILKTGLDKVTLFLHLAIVSSLMRTHKVYL